VKQLCALSCLSVRVEEFDAARRNSVKVCAEGFYLNVLTDFRVE